MLTNHEAFSEKILTYFEINSRDFNLKSKQCYSITFRRLLSDDESRLFRVLPFKRFKLLHYEF